MTPKGRRKINSQNGLAAALPAHPGEYRRQASPDEVAGPARPAGEYPSPLLAAAILTAEDVSFLLVGSAALWLHGEPIPVSDADAVIEPGEHKIRCLGAALARLALRPRAVPPGRMGERSGAGVVECAILEALDSLGGRPDRGYGGPGSPAQS